MRRIWAWTAQQRVASTDLDALGRELGLLPDAAGWRQFADRALLAGGALALGLGLIFLIAANWAELGMWLRFGLAQLAVLGGTLVYGRYGDSRAGRAGLGFSFLALGALMALYGQTYQTGVDPYHLFANWALLSLPWVCLARHSVLWLAWLLLVDIALVRWLGLRVNLFGFLRNEEGLSWALMAVHGGGLLLLELALPRRWLPGREHWLRMALWLVLLAVATWLALQLLFESGSLAQPWLAGLGYLAVVALGWWLMRVRRLSLLGLAALCASGITVLVCLVARAMDDNDAAGNLLFLAMLVTVCTALAGYWLLHLHRSRG